MNQKIKEHIVEEGIYIPDMNIAYPEQPDEYLVNPVKKRTVVCDENYPFLDKRLKARAWRLLEIIVIYILVFPLNKIRYGVKVVGRDKFRKNKKLFRDGVVTICNHVYRWDFLSVMYAVRYRRLWYPARAANMEGSDALIMRGCGAIPIAVNFAGQKKFNEAFDELHSKKQWIHVFPESCRWDYYEPIRPFKRGAFHFAYKYKIPVIPMAISYRKPTGIYKLFKVKHPLITVSIGEPIWPDFEMPQKSSCNKLRNDVHEAVVKLAGIKQNCWESEGD